VSKDELENIALESTRTIDIDEFVPKSDLDPRYLIRPYYLVPDGKVGHDAFAVIRETIRNMNMVAIGRVVLPQIRVARCVAAAIPRSRRAAFGGCAAGYAVGSRLLQKPVPAGPIAVSHAQVPSTRE
jgi:hypothetical protein